jgi:hypothetical protein
MFFLLRGILTTAFPKGNRTWTFHISRTVSEDCGIGRGDQRIRERTKTALISIIQRQKA